MSSINSGLSAKELAQEFNLSIIGNATEPIVYASSHRNQGKGSIGWIKNKDNIKNFSQGYVIVNEDIIKEPINSAVIYLTTKEKAKLVFSKIVNKYFNYEDDVFTNFVKKHSENSMIKIGDNVFIGKDVEIGDGTLIHPNVVIHSKTKIGKNCVIKSHVSLGTEGLGLELDKETDEFVKFPQIGGVILEDNVEIGPCSTVRRSALDDTIIMSGTKIGSLVNVGHNCIIGKNCILTCQIVTSGSSTIGNNVYMGVNSIVKNGINIGNNVTVGQGATVTKHIPDGKTFVGNPAEDIDDYKIWSKLKKKLMAKYKDEL